MGHLLVVGALSTLLLAWFVYEPLPEGWQQPWTTRASLAGYRLNNHIGSAADLMGLDGMVIKRWIMDTLTPYVMAAPHLADVITDDIEVAGVPVRMYVPTNAADKEKLLPAVIFYHGGGWAVGSVVTHDNIARRMAKDVGVYAFSIGYRLAPEHKYPTPLADCVKVTKYLLANAKEFSFDGSRVALAGDSAGGNMAASISLLLRDDKFPVQPKLQVLMYPGLQSFDYNTPSYQANKDGPVLTSEHVVEFTGLYFQGHTKNVPEYLSNRHVSASALADVREKYFPISALPDDDIKKSYTPVVPGGSGGGGGAAGTDGHDAQLYDEIARAVSSPYVCPLAAADVSGLPFAYVVACQYDVLRDDAVWYAARLGTERARLDLAPCFHACFSWAEVLDSAMEVMTRMNDFVRENL